MVAPGPVSRHPPSCPRGTHCPSVQTLTPPCVPALAWLCPLSHCPGAFLSYDSALFWTSHSFKPRLEPGVLWGWWRAAQGPLQPSGHLWGLRIKTWPLVSQGQCGGRGGACAGHGGTPSQTHISSDRNNKAGEGPGGHGLGARPLRPPRPSGSTPRRGAACSQAARNLPRPPCPAELVRPRGSVTQSPEPAPRSPPPWTCADPGEASVGPSPAG